MRHTLPIAPQFYVTAPQVCPYLPDRIERKLFTSIQGDDAQILNDALSQQGFRRSQNILYRPSCNECSACLSARIDVRKFSPSKSQKKILRRNQFLSRRSNSPWATEEQYDLFQKYLRERHANGGMADMDVFEFAAMIEETPIRSRVIEYVDDRNGLTAAALTDAVDARRHALRRPQGRRCEGHLEQQRLQVRVEHEVAAVGGPTLSRSGEARVKSSARREGVS